MYSVAYGYSHMFSRRAMETSGGLALALLVIAETITSFNEMFEGMIIEIMMLAPNTPPSIHKARNHRQKIALSEIIEDLLSSFAALNKDPFGALTHNGNELAKRFQYWALPVVNPMGFVSQDMMTFRNMELTGPQVRMRGAVLIFF
jgi:hypothetical protein